MKNEWIEWHGGECPVPAGTLVDLRYRGKAQEDGIAVPALTFGHRSEMEFWHHESCVLDIIAWRLHQPEQPAWNGEGMPAVGSNAEAFLDNEWRVVKVVYSGDPGSKNEALVFDIETTKPAWADEFRPIRTEAERKRDEFIDQLMSEWLFLGHDREQAGSLYDAIAAGKIPGVKIE